MPDPLIPMRTDARSIEREDMVSGVGAVVIGRNEGQRLRVCLESLSRASMPVVYVDSGSTDGSMVLARKMGITTIELDTPFCAARARNIGYERLRQSYPHLNFVQFVDADCELENGWLEIAAETLMSRSDVAVVGGRVRERVPEASVYQRIAEIEWNSAGFGEVDAVGGIFMVRREAFDAVGGFDSSVPVGEEPELCQRLRREKWKILRIPRDMAWHDLAMRRFPEWWRRMVRNGYGGMDVASRFGIPKYVRMTGRARLWSIWLALTLAAALAALLGQDAAVLLVVVLTAIAPIRLLRVALRTRRNGNDWRTSWGHAALMTIAFLPETVGQIMYVSDRLTNRAIRLVKY